MFTTTCSACVRVLFHGAVAALLILCGAIGGGATALEPPPPSLQQALVAFRSHDFDQAIARYGEAARQDERSAVAWLGRAMASLQRDVQKIRSATGAEWVRVVRPIEDDFLHARRLDPGVLESYQRWAGSPAAKEVLAFQELIDTLAAVHATAAEALLTQNRWEECFTELDRAVQLAPGNPLYWYTRGFFRRAYGRTGEAIADFDELERLHRARPTDATVEAFYRLALSERGAAYHTRGDTDRALRDLDEAIRLTPEDPAPYRHRGECLLTRGEPNRALRDLDEAVRLDPNFAHAYAARSRVHEKMGNAPAARADLDRATALGWKPAENRRPETCQVVSDPADGSSEVDPELQTIRITFSTEMRTDDFNIVRVAGASFPQPGGDEPYTFRDSKNFVMKVKLQPQTSYAFGLNSEKWKGFKQTDGTPLAPTVIRFRTRSSRSVVPVPEPADAVYVTKQPRGHGAREFPSIGAAIRQAQSGATVLIYPGTYNETVVLDRRVTLAPREGQEGKVIVETTNGPCLQMHTEWAAVRGLVFRSRGEASRRQFVALDIPRGQLLVEDCDITSDTLSCVAVYGAEANPTFRRCKIHDGDEVGVFVLDDARGTFEDCVISGHEFSSVVITNNARPTFTNCQITDSKQSGVYAHDKAEGTLEDCDIHDNRLAGVQLRSGARTILRNCKIHDNKQGGVFFTDAGEGTLDGCDIYGNALAGVEITQGARPDLRKCTIRDGLSCGIFVHRGGEGSIEDCEISGNQLSGVEIGPEGNPTVRRCKIHDGKTHGILIREQARGLVEECEIRNNAGRPIEVLPSSSAVLRNNHTGAGGAVPVSPFGWE